MSEDVKEKVEVTLNIDEQIKQNTLELQRLELEARNLELQERKYHIYDLKQSIAERQLKDEQVKTDREAQGRAIHQTELTDNYRFSVCTHKKGGTVSARDVRVLKTGGNSPQYAVMKHTMINGDVWIRCMRCGRTWAPPVEKNFYFDAKGRRVAPRDGTLDSLKFAKAAQEYRDAIDFPTNNTTSHSVLCQFKTVNEQGQEIDATNVYRNIVANTTLR